MYDAVIDLLRAHDYFRGINGAVLGEIASLAKATNYDDVVGYITGTKIPNEVKIAEETLT